MELLIKREKRHLRCSRLTTVAEEDQRELSSDTDLIQILLAPNRGFTLVT